MARRVGRRAFGALVAVVAAMVAIWPVWVSDGSVRVKCGAPVAASHVDDADGHCRPAGQRRLFTAADIAILGALTLAIEEVVHERRNPSPASGPRWLNDGHVV